MFKDKIKILLLSIISIFVIISCNVLENKTVKVPKTIVQARANKKFPMKKDFVLGKIVMDNPEINMEGDRMYVVVDYEISLALVGPSKRGKIHMNSKIDYNGIKENAYFKDFVMEKITNEDGKEIGNSVKELEIIKNLLSKIVENEPVYEYKKEEIKPKLKIKRMYIRNGNFYIET